VGSNPFFRQIWTGRLPGRCVGSRSCGVPGNAGVVGFVVLQWAKAQSVLGIVAPVVTLPFIVSCVWVVRTTPCAVVSSDAGRYGMGLPMTFSACDAAPLRLTIRPSVNPVVPVATGVFTHSLFTRPVVTGDVLEA
jgi:hypothetical protein